MKKRTARRIFVLLGIGVLGYCGWCFRPLYVRPQMDFPEGVPPEARSTVKREYPRPKIDVPYLRALLQNPYQKRIRPIRFYYGRGTDGIYYVGEEPQGYVFLFAESDGRWELTGTTEGG